ncbi:MAG: hypothetical protein LBN07_03485 [Christensenellaceae bacterium]|nr:hypothetical protein [Christensenellaceae bacterium]
MSKISYEQYTAYLTKTQDKFFVANILWDDKALAVTNNYILYVNGSERSAFIDTRFAFLVRELLLFAKKSKLSQAVGELEESIKQEILKSNIKNSISVSDDGVQYSVCAGDEFSYDSSDELGRLCNSKYEGIKNPLSKAFLKEVVVDLERLITAL